MNKKIASELIKIAKSLVAYLDIHFSALKDTNRLLEKANGYGLKLDINNLPRNWGFPEMNHYKIHTSVDENGQYSSKWNDSELFAERDEQDDKYNIVCIIVRIDGKTLAKLGKI